MGLRVVRFLNKEVRSEAAAAVGWPLETLEERLAEMGLTTIGALQQADESVLAQRFGARHGRDLHARA